MNTHVPAFNTAHLFKIPFALMLFVFALQHQC